MGAVLNDDGSLALTADGWLGDIEWSEFTSRQGATQDATFGRDGGNSAVLTIQVYFDRAKDAIQKLTGTNTFNSATGKLERQLPTAHPVYDWCYCDRILSLHPVRFEGKAFAPGGVRFSEYQLMYITARFTQPKWNRTISDADLLALFGDGKAEWNRFCVYRPRGKGDSLTYEPGKLKWKAGPNSGEALSIYVPNLVNKVAIQIEWCRLPYRGILSTATGRADNLDAGINCVNANDWNGFPANTLLFTGYDLVPQETAGPTPFNLGDTKQTPLEYSCVMDFEYFAPPTAGGLRGTWQMMPANDGLWYEIAFADDLTRTYLPTYDFTKLFQLLA